MSPRRKALVWVWRKEPDGARVLLLRRAPPRAPEWHPVTGNGEAGEAPEATAAREVREETGLAGDLRALDLVHRYANARGEFEEHAFALRVRALDEPTLSHEHTDARWVPPAEAMRLLAHDHQRAALARLAAVLRAEGA